MGRAGSGTVTGGRAGSVSRNTMDDASLANAAIGDQPAAMTVCGPAPTGTWPPTVRPATSSRATAPTPSSATQSVPSPAAARAPGRVPGPVGRKAGAPCPSGSRTATASCPGRVTETRPSADTCIAAPSPGKRMSRSTRLPPSEAKGFSTARLASSCSTSRRWPFISASARQPSLESSRVRMRSRHSSGAGGRGSGQASSQASGRRPAMGRPVCAFDT